jgi:hypothetical protein
MGWLFKDKPPSPAQKEADRIIKKAGGKPIGKTGKKYDMTEAVKREKGKGKK